MDHKLSTSTSVEINASATKVWATLTNPEIIKEYLHDTNTKTDWKEGSPIKFEGEYNGTTYADGGTILKNRNEELLSYTYWTKFSGLEDKPENYSTITYIVQVTGDNKTKFTWEQTGFISAEARDRISAGMPVLLQQIKEMTER